METALIQWVVKAVETDQASMLLQCDSEMEQTMLQKAVENVSTAYLHSIRYVKFGEFNTVHCCSFEPFRNIAQIALCACFQMYKPDCAAVLAEKLSKNELKEVLFNSQTAEDVFQVFHSMDHVRLWHTFAQPFADRFESFFLNDGFIRYFGKWCDEPAVLDYILEQVPDLFTKTDKGPAQLHEFLSFSIFCANLKMVERVQQLFPDFDIQQNRNELFGNAMIGESPQEACNLLLQWDPTIPARRLHQNCCEYYDREPFLEFGNEKTNGIVVTEMDCPVLLR